MIMKDLVQENPVATEKIWGLNPGPLTLLSYHVTRLYAAIRQTEDFSKQ